MKDKLIPMSDFVINETEKSDGNENALCILFYNYAKLLKQPLTLGAFVPVDLEDNILEEPEPPHTYASENTDAYIEKYNADIAVYNKAKENVLFEGFSWNDGTATLYYNNSPFWIGRIYGELIENVLLNINPKFTQTAKNQIYGNI